MKKIIMIMMMSLVLIPASAQLRTKIAPKKTASKEHLKVFNIPITGSYDAFAKKLESYNFRECETPFVLFGTNPKMFSTDFPDNCVDLISLEGGDFWEFKNCKVQLGSVNGADSNVVTWVAIQPLEWDIYKLYDLIHKLTEKYGPCKKKDSEPQQTSDYYFEKYTSYVWNVPNKGTIEVRMDEFKALLPQGGNETSWEMGLDGYVIYTDYTHQMLIDDIKK